MFAAVDDVHHGNGQNLRIDPAYIAIQRQTACISRGLCNRKADTKNGISAQA